MNKITLLKKATPKTIVGDVKKAPEGLLYRITGIARDVITGETQFGPWTAFEGEFLIQRADGVTMTSNRCFLPQPGEGMLANQLNEEVSEVKFSFDVLKKIRDDLQIGYEYLTETVLEMKASNTLQALLDSLPSLPALPAPEEK